MLALRTLKLFDSVLGRLAVLAVPGPHAVAAAPDRIKRILVIRPGGIGDAVLIIPALHCLKKTFPQARIDILAENRNSAIFSLCSGLGLILHYTRPADITAVLKQPYDAVIDSEQWHRLSAVVARLTGSGMLLGFATNERKKLFTHPAAYSQDAYEVENFLNLIRPLTGDVFWQQEIPFLSITPDLSMKAKNLLAALLPKRPPVCLFPGGSIEERRWGTGRFHETARALDAKGFGIVVVGGKTDRAAGDKIIQGVPRALNLAGMLSLPETAAVLNESSLLITGDSGIMHIGYGLGMKILALFGPGRQKKWAPRNGNCAVLNKKLSCSPCTTFGYTDRCRRQAACMKSISVEDVVQTAFRMMGRE